MKKLLFIILLTSAICSTYAQNKVITQADLVKCPYATVGDGYFDTPTNAVPFADGINKLAYTRVSSTFPTLRENATLWIDGDKIGKLCEIRFVNVTATTPWHIQNATLKPVPNTRVDGVYTPNGYGGFLYLIQGLKNFRMEGSSEKYPGLTGMQKGNFLQGRFGFGASSTGVYQGYHAYSISVLDGGSMYFEGMEGEHGFSVLRAQGGDYDWTVSLTLTNFFFHDSSSETIYLGATHGPPLAKLKDLKITNGIIACAGSEGLQVQHLIGNSDISNITLFGSSAGYINQFQPFQDTGSQLSVDAGNGVVKNIIIDGWGSNAINFFGSAYTSTEKNFTLKNILINNGRGPAMYFHPSLKNGMKWNIENISIRKPTKEYFINTKIAPTNFLISANNGTDTINIKNIKYDGLITLFQNITRIKVGENFKTEMTNVEYVNSGFYEIPNKIKFYERYYGKYLISGTDLKPVDYKAGDILQDRETGFYQVWCKVLTDFTANEVRPKNRPDCIILTWDSKGVRSDQITWSGSSPQKPYPPFDCRVQHENYYAKQGIGCIEPAPPIEEELRLAKELIQILTNDKLALLNQSVIDKAAIVKINSDLALLINEVALLKVRMNGLYLDLNVTLEKYK